MPDTEAYGIRSFVYRAQVPFHPGRLNAFVERPWPGVVRAKGFFWLATRPQYVGEISRAGALVRTQRRGLWWAAVPKERWPDHPEWRASMRPYLDPVRGDRRQRIVFVGSAGAMDGARIRRELDAALVGDPAHFTPSAWRHLPDPFPSWQRDAA